jgi:hypothetical protein
MPSYFESLSMVALEAWALGRPVLANGKCDVLKGQCIRSNAGLYYESLPEFVETLRAIERNRWLSSALGKNGRMFFREHYDWPVLERKYLDVFARLAKEPGGKTVPPLPGWLNRRRQDLSPAEIVAAELPKGPVVEARRNDSSTMFGTPYLPKVPEARTRASVPEDHRAERFARSGSKPSANRRRYGGAQRRGGPHR